MAFFKNKKKEEPSLGINESNFGREAQDDKNDKSTKSNAKYKIVIKESLGSITRTVKTIEAERFIDEDDHVVYLRNVKEKFLEVFPEDHNDLIKLTDEELVSKISEIRSLLRQPKRMREKDINPHNLEADLLKFEAKRRCLKYGSDDSYVSFDDKGRPEFYFLRKGSTFYPCKWDVDTSTIYTASDNKKKKSVIALRNKEAKYKGKRFIETATIIMMVIIVILAAVLIWGYYKQFKSYDASEIAAIKRACVQDTIETTEAIHRAAEDVARITNKIEGSITNNNIVIDGIIPG